MAGAVLGREGDDAAADDVLPVLVELDDDDGVESKYLRPAGWLLALAAPEQL